MENVLNDSLPVDKTMYITLAKIENYTLKSTAYKNANAYLDDRISAYANDLSNNISVALNNKFESQFMPISASVGKITNANTNSTDTELSIWTGSINEYNNIQVKNNNMLYFIVEQAQ